ncbi:arginase family protein [Streptomyces sp. NPDC001852]|uniref:arginase family protein n=1 Tax=Streptomyces sp. NPDC001852 TaxID=3364619 RepID=UPI003689EBAB
MLIHSVPQQHGALTRRAPALPAGCRALSLLAAEVLDAPVREIEVASANGDRDGRIAHHAALTTNFKAQRTALSEAAGPVLTIGGDCSVELAPLEAARRRHGARLTALWFNAHADLNTPETSPSGAFHGMVLRAAFGDGDQALVADPPLAKWQVALFGVRNLDAAEQELLPIIRHTSLDGPRELYLHIDLDVLDPAEFSGLNCPEPGGLTIEELAAAIRSLTADASGLRRPIVGAGITECVTADPAELRKLTPVLEAVGTLLDQERQ